MTLPGGQLSTTPIVSDILSPDGRDRVDFSVDYELGGIALNDPSQGLQYQVWVAYVRDGTIYARPEDGGAETAITSDTNITEVSLSFDQNMRPTLAYVANGVTKLYWYDTQIGGPTTTTFAGAFSPFLTLDDKRESQLGTSDLLFFYLRDGSLYYRQQRDRFGVEYQLATGIPVSVDRIVRVGMGTNLRLQVVIIGQPTAVHTDLRTDTLYTAAGGSVLPLFDSAAEVKDGLWRSKVFVLDGQPSFGWGIVEGDYPCRLRVYADGALFYTTPDITSNDAFRLPVGRFREWQLEVESAGRIVGVTVANSIAELNT